MNLCHCGCGNECNNLFILGHNSKNRKCPWRIGIPTSGSFKKSHTINLGIKRTKEYKNKMSKIKKGIPRPEYVKKKISSTIKEKKLSKGKNNPNWRGGIGKLPYSFNFNKELKELIKKRDNYVCQLCFKSSKLQVHHIDYDKKNCNPENLITLCRSCHCKTNYNRKYWKKYCKEILK